MLSSVDSNVFYVFTMLSTVDSNVLYAFDIR